MTRQCTGIPAVAGGITAAEPAGEETAARAEPAARTNATAAGGGEPAGPGTAGGIALSRRLPCGELTAVADVRSDLRGLLRRRSWGGAERAEVAELLTSELVTNALVHTDRGAEVTASLVEDRAPAGNRAPRTAERLRVEVRDYVTRRPRLRDPDGEGTGGRGLLLVEALADGWGVRPQDSGKVVWFELDGVDGGGGGPA